MAFGFGFGLPRGGNTVWSPASLFAQNEPGVWYDPSDMTTLFQDAAGTTPVTAVEQAVGLMLDKSRGLALGPNIAPTAFSGYNATVSNGGVFPCVVTSTVNNNFGVVASSLLTVGKYYEFVISWVGNTNGKTLRISDGSNTGAFSNAVSGTLTNRIVAGFASIYAYIVSGAIGETFTITSITTKEITGIHATSLTTSRPVLTARVNLLTKTEQFNDAAWVKDGASASANSIISPSGATDADTLVEAATTAVHRIYVNTASGNSAKVSSIYAKAGTRNWLRVEVSGSVNAFFNLASGALGTVSAGVTATITPVGNGWYRCTAYYAIHATFAIFALASADNTISYTGDGTSGIYIWGASLTTADQASLGYQRVNTATDYDTVGFPMWLKADGVDDYMVTGTLAAPVNLDLTSTDKVTVATGVRKLSDAATGLITELSATADSFNGAFYLAAPVGVNANYQTQIGPVAARVFTQYFTYTAPITNVVSIAANAALSGAAQISTKINGIVNAGIPFVSGTGMVGNFGTYPLYQFRRAGTSLPFNGLSAGLTVVGRTLTAAELSQLETYYQQKTKAY